MGISIGPREQAPRQNCRCFFPSQRTSCPQASAQTEPGQGGGTMDALGLGRSWATNLFKVCNKLALAYGIAGVYHCLHRTHSNLVFLKCLLSACQSQMERCMSPWQDGFGQHEKMALKYKWVTHRVAEGDLVMLSAVQSVESKPSYWLTTFFLLP